MAKLNSLFRYDGTFGGVTVVRSRACGDHIRKARTKFTLSEEMKKSTEKLKLANVYAKAFKDAVDPYRRDFRDGQLWQRLVSLFKTQLSKEGKVDFKILDGQELNKIHPLDRIIFTEAKVSQLEGILKVSATSVFKQDSTRGRANGLPADAYHLFRGHGPGHTIIFRKRIHFTGRQARQTNSILDDPRQGNFRHSGDHV
jgi:hypothetical protein